MLKGGFMIMLNENVSFAVAIDGPVGVGKSTTAKMAAQMLNITYIDTGAMYRAMALYAVQNGVDFTNAENTEEILREIKIDLRHENGAQHVYLNNTDVTDLIRTREISELTSVVATCKAVREKLVEQQREIAKAGAVVMDGRDIGSHVLPRAQVKIYLDAAPEVRAKRRMLDLEIKGQPAEYDIILRETMARDARDKNRAVSPLIQTPDAIYIDTSFMTQQEVAEKIVAYVKEVSHVL
jgi:cytidylate kinase